MGVARGRSKVKMEDVARQGAHRPIHLQVVVRVVPEPPAVAAPDHPDLPIRVPPPVAQGGPAPGGATLPGEPGRPDRTIEL